MFLQERVNEINKRLNTLKTSLYIVIWGAGLHTEKLFKESKILSYKIKKIVDMDERKWGEFFFCFVIENPYEVEWKNVDAVVISAPMYEKKIESMLKEKFLYVGDIIKFYNNDNYIPFYLLHDERNTNEVRYLGKFDSWKEAELKIKTKGYEDENIIKKVISATEQVKNGDAIWERDGFPFYQQKYVYQICASILRCAVQNNNQGVRILDVGGSLGSTYFQNRKFLSDINNLEYVVAEQSHFADYGHKNIEDGVLKFISSTEQWEELPRFDIILLSGTLQYISGYDEIVAKLAKAKAKYIILDRILVGDRGRICIETVPQEIVKSSYPLRIFSKEDINSFFSVNYDVIEEDESSTPGRVYFEDGEAEYKYYVFKYMEEMELDEQLG